MKKKLLQIFLPFNILLSAISLINLANDLVPALVKWNEFFVYVFEFVKVFRDIILLPITYPILKVFNFSVPGWIRSYVFLGILFYNTYNSSYRIICGSINETSVIALIFGDKRFSRFKIIIYRIFLWPVLVLELVTHYLKGEYRKQHNVITLWGKYVFWVGLTVVVLAFMNWIFWQIFDFYN